MGITDYKTAKDRRDFIKKKLNTNLSDIKKAFIDNEKHVHCENLLGGISIPLGVAGPIDIKGNHAKGKYFIPLATTEGALVASVQRGTKAISLSKGCQVCALRVGITRGPVFFIKSLNQKHRFIKWLESNRAMLAKKAESSSNHLKVIKIENTSCGNYIYLRIYYDTSDAMGMNMATIATQEIINTIEKKAKIKCISIAGNYDIDKKPAWLNVINKRGFSVEAEAVIKKDIVKKVLKTTAKDVYNVWISKCMIGSAISGSLGFNAHYANICAALFVATGQDIAHVVEGSLGITTVNILDNNDLYISVSLPSVLLGIIGGGTKLKTQREALSIIKVKSSIELAEVLAGAVLAGELSLLASLAEGSLARVHEKLGR